jgi:hypothetical protein
MPLRLRVCGRRIGAIEVEGAVGEGLDGGDGEGPVGEGLGDGDGEGPAGEGLGDGDSLADEGLGDTLGVGETEPKPAKGVTGNGLLGEGDSPGEAGDVGEVGVEGRALDVGKASTGEAEAA